MEKLKALADLFKFSEFIDSPIEYRKALILTWCHILLIGLLSIIFTIYTFLGGGHPKIAMCGLVVTILSFWGFKRWGNILLSSNFVALVWFFFVAFEILKTGGVYSENVPWLIGSPVLAIIFMNNKWGLFWMFIIHAFFTSIFFYGIYYPEINLNVHSEIHFFLSYTVLSFFCFAFVTIFNRSQSKVLRELKEKNVLLEEQKKEISTHSEVLKFKDERLQKSNADLQNFAYSASHDLKEPLRMIGMYTQLLQRRIAPALDERSEEYMFYMTDGVKRMQKLLDDLLLYSRLGKNDNDIQDVDINQTMLLVIYNLTVTIKETNTSIIFSNLPTICASSTEMMQLFQNMVANSIKFRRVDVAPEIMIIHAERGDEHLITLQDNGIGIKEEYKEKVFNIFTKLHSTSQYEGSGIGLATCKKIVEEMGGRMWLTSEEGVGTRFYFTFPKKARKKKAEQKEAVAENGLGLSH
jgi:signal transduction histidine kinase